MARNVDAISTSPMSELCELRRLRALEDSRLSPATPRHAKPSKEARPPKLLYFDGIQWRAAARRAQARMGRKSMAEREKRKRWLRKPCMARLKGVFFRFLKRVWRPTNGPTVGPSFCPSVRSSAKVSQLLGSQLSTLVDLSPFFKIRMSNL